MMQGRRVSGFCTWHVLFSDTNWHFSLFLADGMVFAYKRAMA